jgi:uncharacterized protein YqgC (DUF456 family)
MSAWSSALQQFSGVFDWACIGTWALTVTLLGFGLAGSILPLIPGPLIIFVACLAHSLIRAQSAMSWWGLAIELLLLVAAYVTDFASGAVGTKFFGGSKWAIWGVFVGGLIGMFFSLPGIILGPIIGAFAFELLFDRKRVRAAAKSTWGTVVGTGLGYIARLIIAVAMVIWFFVDALWL